MFRITRSCRGAIPAPVRRDLPKTVSALPPSACAVFFCPSSSKTRCPNTRRVQCATIDDRDNRRRNFQMADEFYTHNTPDFGEEESGYLGPPGHVDRR